MTVGQEELIKNYNSLRCKTNSGRIDLMIHFCVYFQSDDAELYEDYERTLSDSDTENISTDALIELYARRYNLDPQTDATQIMQLFIKNAIRNGVSYHLNSTANFDSIMEKGLGIYAIGHKTEEREDFELLQNSVTPDIFIRLQPFSGEKEGSKLYYSNIPILKARYGDRPEWLKELKLNSPNVTLSSTARTLVDRILYKYDVKYAFAEKILFLIPNPISNIPEEIIDDVIQSRTPQEVIGFFHNRILTQKDMHTSEHIPPSSIIAVDLKTHDMYARNVNGIVEAIKPQASASQK